MTFAQRVERIVAGRCPVATNPDCKTEVWVRADWPLAAKLVPEFRTVGMAPCQPGVSGNFMVRPKAPRRSLLEPVREK